VSYLALNTSATQKAVILMVILSLVAGSFIVVRVKRRT